MKLFFYLLLPMLILKNYWMYLLGGLLAVFFIPGKWWTVSPAGRPDSLIGKLLPFLDISLRNLTIRIFAIAVFFILMPFCLILPVAVAFALPVIIVAKIFSSDRETPVLGLVLVSGLVILTIAGLLAPMNLIPIAMYFIMQRPAGNIIEFLAVGQDAVRDDLFMGVLGIVVVSLILLLDAFWRLRQARQVENLPTSKVSSISLGLVELKGTARKTGDHPDRSEPILELKMDLFSYFRPYQKLEAFFLEDETGKVLVEPQKCRIRTGWITDLINLCSGFHEVVLNERVERYDSKDTVIRTLMDGDPVYVIGNAARNVERKNATEADGPAFSRANAIQPGSEITIRPSGTSTWNPSLWIFLFGSAKMPSGKDIFNVFFISDSREEVAKKHILRGFTTVWLISFFWLLASGFLIWSSYWPVRQVLNPEGWRNAYWRGGNERFLRFQKYLESFSAQSEDAIPPLMEAIGYEDVRYKEPATSALTPLIPVIGDRAEEVVSLLRSNLQSTDAYLLQTTMLAIGVFGPKAASAVPELILQLKCRSTNTYEVTPNIIRFQAAVALGRIGPPASMAIQPLTEALGDPNPMVRDAAKQALWMISSSSGGSQQ